MTENGRNAKLYNRVVGWADMPETEMRKGCGAGSTPPTR